MVTIKTDAFCKEVEIRSLLNKCVLRYLVKILFFKFYYRQLAISLLNYS